MNSQKVSIIIPVYNSQKFLAESIESALNQTYKNIEILVIDDGSTDNSLKILKQYAQKIVIITQENKGLAGALNVGIKNMTGNWVKLLSADDVLYLDAITTLIDQTKRLSDNTVLYSNWDIIDDHGKKLRTFHESCYNDLTNFDFNVRLLDGQQININTALIPSSLFEMGCLFEKLDDPVAIDYEFFLKAGILFNTKFYLVSNPLIQYRVHENQLSHKKIIQTHYYLSVVQDLILSKLDKSIKEEYLNALKKYKEKKSISKKTMEFGLNMISKILPERLSDEILVFYLNKIRATR